MLAEIKINKIISGGQSGVDRSALDFSIKYNIPHGGWCPKNRWAEDGQIPDRYHLTETKEKSPDSRTQKNVISSDATLIIYRGIKDEGTYRTMEFCKQQNKPFLEVDLSNRIDKTAFENWLNSNQIKMLNIAGSRESNSPGIYNETRVLLEYLFFG